MIQVGYRICHVGSSILGQLQKCDTIISHCKGVEFLILVRLLIFPTLIIWHTEKGYILSRGNAIFATQEVITRYVRDGSQVFMCLYCIQKAFNSVEYPVLLDRLCEARVNGKTWWPLKSWCDGASCRVQCALSNSFTVEKIVKEGSVLSPTLFLLVMDPLLKQLELLGHGLSVDNFHAGGFFNADDI